jgi:flagellar assembly protein FliH
LSNNIIPSEALTEWSAWRVDELGNLPAAKPAEPAPVVEEVAPAEAEVPAEEEEGEAAPLSYPTAAELEAIHQEAWQAGFEAGLAEGRSQGHSEGHEAGRSAVEAEFDTLWQPLKQLADNFSGELARLEQELGNDILRVAFELANKLVAAEVQLNREAIRGVLHEALAEWPEELARARIRVNPEDAAAVRALLAQETPHTTWQWVEDPAIERGGCVIDTKSVSMDLTLEKRREALATALGLLAAPGTDDIEADDA